MSSCRALFHTGSQVSSGSTLLIAAISVLWMLSLAGCGQPQGEAATPVAKTKEQLIERGKYLVTIGGCNDCHTTKVMADGVPQLDMNMHLAGHPAGAPMPKIEPAVLRSGWALMAMDGTCFVGPWGVSYAANLTPDMQTGIGAWQSETFISSMRNGKHLGSGRPILPPMPWQGVAMMTDEDLNAMFTYLKSLKPVHNPVPAPLAPDALTAMK